MSMAATRLPSPPRAEGYPIIGLLPALARDPLGALTRAAREHGDVVHLGTSVRPGQGLQDHILLSRPDHIHYCLMQTGKRYVKDYLLLRRVLGEGLLTGEGATWQRQRRLMQPAFHRQRLKLLVEAIVDSVDACLGRLRSFSAARGPVEIAAEMSHMTMNVAARTLFGADISDSEVGETRAALRDVLEHVEQRIYSHLAFPDWVPTPANRRFRRAVATLDRIAYRIIQQRRRSNTDTGDLLSMLLSARDEDTGHGMSDQQLRDEVVTLFVAGHETTANALTWTLHLLSSHPRVEARLRSELGEVLAGRRPTFEDLPRLTYTRMVFEEALRLYPPAWVLFRKAVVEDEIGGFRIPPRAIVLMSPYVTHRRSDLFERPDQFEPERFSEERSAQRPPFAYFPFGGGPRICMGNHFALMEGQIALAMLLQSFGFAPVPGRHVMAEAMVTLRPPPALRMAVFSA